MLSGAPAGVRVDELRDAPAPDKACARFLDLPGCLLLESVATSGRPGRYSFVTADPFLTIRSRGGEVRLESEGSARNVAADPFSVLAEELARHRTGTLAGLPPFQGGVAGYLAYDLAHHLEALPAPRYDDLGLPDLCVGLYDWVLAWDHDQERVWSISTGLPLAAGGTREARAVLRAEQVRRRLDGPPVERPPTSAHARPRPGIETSGPPSFPVPGVPGVRSNFSREHYLAAVERTREYIFAGDIFQANLSQRLQAPVACDAWSLYRRLRCRNPAPFAAYFDFGDATVVSSSPERFVQLGRGRVETRPIKGTAPRGDTPGSDRALRDALRASAKDVAENVMIVDLLRNDLSIVCLDGSVEVPELCVVESYARVHHLVSSVVGALRPGLDAVDLLRATFPGGSITGAPKVRAMEVIAELEPTRRGVYTGAIGYLGFDGAMDTSIAIRTMVVRDGHAFFQVGGGIVADSDPAREYEETLHKARGMIAALEG